MFKEPWLCLCKFYYTLLSLMGCKFCGIVSPWKMTPLTKKNGICNHWELKSSTCDLKITYPENYYHENLWVRHRRHHHLRFKLCVGSFCVDLGHVECTMFGFQCFLGGRHHHLRFKLWWWRPPRKHSSTKETLKALSCGGGVHQGNIESLKLWWWRPSRKHSSTKGTLKALSCGGGVHQGNIRPPRKHWKP